VTPPAAAPPSAAVVLGEGGGLAVSAPSGRVRAQILNRLLSKDFPAWSATAARVGNCAKPVRVRGSALRVEASTGAVVDEWSPEGGVLHLACGNRRESACVSCSRVYAADTFHLIRAGVAGGKGVPDHVADNPLVFATLTAPSFGAVHGRSGPGGRCRPRTRGRTCSHGTPLGCPARHTESDPVVGTPICAGAGCYDHTGQVVWQWWAPEMWRRFTIGLRRAVAARLGVTVTGLKRVASVQYAKVAEYQRRGVVHFHALIRLDGPADGGNGYAVAPPALTAADLARAVTQTAAGLRYTAPPAHPGDPGRVLGLGAQTDVRPVRHGNRTDEPAGPLTPEQVAGYLAKYATKSAADTTDGARGCPHLRTLRRTAEDLARAATTRNQQTRRAHLTGSDHGDGPPAEDPYTLLSRWVHTLGFRGHFLSKSRKYSTTLGALRRARQRFQALTARAARTGQPIDTTDLETRLLTEEADQETTLVIGNWEYTGTGWADQGETELARAAADQARQHAKTRTNTKYPTGFTERTGNRWNR
jgi:hypothetical protein